MLAKQIDKKFDNTVTRFTILKNEASIELKNVQNKKKLVNYIRS